MRVNRATVVWAHWGEFTVELYRDLVGRCLIKMSAVAGM